MPHMSRRHFVGCGCLAVGSAFVSGCTVNPATGRSSFTGLMSADQEIQTGKEAHPQILEEFGGDYGTAALRSYVNDIGQRLANSARASGDVPDPRIRFTFTVLNSPIVNAFALPGGYVYISRGLLALAGNEAELAGVLGHEIGHITARHTAERYSQSMATQLLAVGAGILTGSGEIAQLGMAIGSSVLAGWSRDQELEADTLGVRYIARTGYEPRGMASFLTKLRDDSILQAKIAGQPPGTVDQTHAMSTHPRTIDRVELALPEANKYAVPNPRVNQDGYLRQVDGIIFGDDPKQGVVRGRDFLHPDLRFAFRVPDGFQIVNGQNAVQAVHRNGAAILFQGGKKPAGQNIRQTMVGALGNNGPRLSNVESIEVNGLPAATGTSRVNVNQGPRDLRMVAIQTAADQAYLFLFLSPPNLTGQLNVPFRETTYSFRRLSASEAAGIRPLTLRTITVRSGDTVQGLAARLPFSDYKVERFATLNGLQPNEGLRSGELVKTVVS